MSDPRLRNKASTGNSGGSSSPSMAHRHVLPNQQQQQQHQQQVPSAYAQYLQPPPAGATPPNQYPVSTQAQTTPPTQPQPLQQAPPAEIQQLMASLGPAAAANPAMMAQLLMQMQHMAAAAAAQQQQPQQQQPNIHQPPPPQPAFIQPSQQPWPAGPPPQAPAAAPMMGPPPGLEPLAHLLVQVAQRLDEVHKLIAPLFCLVQGGVPPDTWLAARFHETYRAVKDLGSDISDVRSRLTQLENAVHRNASKPVGPPPPPVTQVPNDLKRPRPDHATPTSEYIAAHPAHANLCFNCGAPDHQSKRCPKPTRNCHRCGKPGHIVQFCFFESDEAAAAALGATRGSKKAKVDHHNSPKRSGSATASLDAAEPPKLPSAAIDALFSSYLKPPSGGASNVPKLPSPSIAAPSIVPPPHLTVDHDDEDNHEDGAIEDDGGDEFTTPLVPSTVKSSSPHAPSLLQQPSSTIAQEETDAEEALLMLASGSSKGSAEDLSTGAADAQSNVEGGSGVEGAHGPTIFGSAMLSPSWGPAIVDGSSTGDAEGTRHGEEAQES